MRNWGAEKYGYEITGQRLRRCKTEQPITGPEKSASKAESQALKSCWASLSFSQFVGCQLQSWTGLCADDWPYHVRSRIYNKKIFGNREYSLSESRRGSRAIANG